MNTVLLNTAYIFIGLALLVKAGDMLIDGAVSIAKKLKMSNLVIGLTIVAMGTSFPELFVSALSAARGNSAISIGNVVGSNTLNIALILGVSVIIYPVIIKENFNSNLVFISLSCIIFYIFASNLSLGTFNLDGYISRTEGFILFLVMIIYTWYLYKYSVNNEEEDSSNDKIFSYPMDIFFIVVGVIGLWAGSDRFVEGGIFFARILNISDKIIGVTLIALGTSLPEFVVSVRSSLSGRADVSLGNIVGSNIFNIFGVLGITAIITPIELKDNFLIDYIMMVIVTFILLICIIILKKINRLSGFIFLIIYTAYNIYLLS